ncbi:MAG: exodeoxyribonuclease VII small subunit [Eggerthellaceae bacterium]|nr:exodeoxyribonuclease VII small subunit [Eggerthellaceae bacterium]
MTNSESAVSKPEVIESNEFEAVRKRLEEIAREVDDDDMSLDDALDLYEEAVKLGLKASSLLEVGIVAEEEPAPEPEDASGADAAAVSESDQA